MTTKNSDLKKNLEKLEETLAVYFIDKAPFSIPKNIKELIVTFAPYLTILGVIIYVPSVLAVLGLGALVSPFTVFMGPSYAVHYGFNYILSMIVLAAVVVLEILAIPGLFKKQRKAWLYLFYASLVSLVSGLISGGLIGALIGTIIGWYVLFQVREYYK